jgi:antibiotic biosynthesis monooxygenase (ABM) superfamily enzyme
MYARRTVTKAAPEQAEKAKEVVENSLIPKARQLPGFAGGYWLIDRATGEALTFTFFDTKENLEASAAQAEQLRTGVASEIGATVQEVGGFEVGVDTGQKVHRGATHARVLNFEGDPAAIDQAKQMISERVVPAVRNFPGFLGGFWLFDREAGKGVGVTLFDSAENLKASREAAAGVRAQGQSQTGGRFSEFKEYEVLTKAETPAGVGAS